MKSGYLHNLDATHLTSQGAHIDTKAAFVEQDNLLDADVKFESLVSTGHGSKAIAQTTRGEPSHRCYGKRSAYAEA